MPNDEKIKITFPPFHGTFRVCIVVENEKGQYAGFYEEVVSGKSSQPVTQELERKTGPISACISTKPNQS